MLYSAIKSENLIEYKKRTYIYIQYIQTIGQVISYILVYILYNYFYDVNILSVSDSILMFFLIISTIYLKKSSRYLDNKKNI